MVDHIVDASAPRGRVEIRSGVSHRRRWINADKGRIVSESFAPGAEEIIIDVADKTCACCGSLKHRIDEDVSERLDVMPAQFKVIVTRRPKYACQAWAAKWSRRRRWSG